MSNTQLDTIDNTTTKNTIVTGNTKNGYKLRGRHFQLTLNTIDKYEELRDYLTKYSTLKYLISCIETAPTTGHEHIHIYVQYTQPKILNSKNLYGAHIETCIGTPKQNRDYIVKDGNILDEIGEFKTNGGISGHTIEDILRMTEGEIYATVDYKYYNVIKKMINDRKRLTLEDHHKEDMNVIYLIGDSGMGKSKIGYEILSKIAVPGAPYDEVSYSNGFWLGVSDSCDYCIYDDFRDSVMRPYEFIRFIDYNKHILNIKGGQLINNYKTIIITSKQEPWELWKNSNEEKKQWLRRMKIYEITRDENEKKKIRRIPEDEIYLMI